MDTTHNVLDNHLASFFRGDLEALLADYAPGAVMFTAQGTLVGAGAIRPVFVRLFEEFSRPGASFNLLTRTVVDEFAYIAWTAETAENRYEMATDTFTVRGGKIVAQSFTAKVASKANASAMHHA
jgi:hypothetical protein